RGDCVAVDGAVAVDRRPLPGNRCGVVARGRGRLARPAARVAGEHGDGVRRAVGVALVVGHPQLDRVDAGGAVVMRGRLTAAFEAAVVGPVPLVGVDRAVWIARGGRIERAAAVVGGAVSGELGRGELVVEAWTLENRQVVELARVVLAGRGV